MNTLTNFFVTGMLLTCIVGYDIQHSKPKPIVVYAEEVKPTLEATTAPQEVPNDIEGYIRYKFGEHADKAMLLLKGNGPGSCAENRTLDPKAVNWNSDGSRDRGIFQINDRYHPVNDECAFDYRCNIDYAYRMFSRDDYTFIRWTAGRCLGI